eukprot:scaffold54524_cov64-Phaeocystis_antarctica.AAC.3
MARVGSRDEFGDFSRPFFSDVGPAPRRTARARAPPPRCWGRKVPAKADRGHAWTGKGALYGHVHASQLLTFTVQWGTVPRPASRAAARGGGDIN